MFLTTCVNFCSMSVIEESFDCLDGPIERIAGADIPMPYAANLERIALPQVCILRFSFCFSCNYIQHCFRFASDFFILLFFLVKKDYE